MGNTIGAFAGLLMSLSVGAMPLNAQAPDLARLEEVDQEYGAMIGRLARQLYLPNYAKTVHDTIKTVYLLSGAPVDPQVPQPAGSRFRGRQPAGVIVTFVLYDKPNQHYPVERAVVYGELDATGSGLRITCEQYATRRQLCVMTADLKTNEIEVIKLEFLYEYWAGQTRPQPTKECVARVTKAELSRREISGPDPLGRIKVHFVATARCRELVAG